MELAVGSTVESPGWPGAAQVPFRRSPTVKFHESLDEAALGELIERGAAGDLEAMETLYHHWKSPLYGVIYRYTYDRAAAEDLLQETFIKAFTHLPDVKDAKLFPAWIYRIAINTSLSYLRERKRRLRALVPLEDIADSLAEAAPRDHDTVSSRSLEEALRTLPEKLKTVFLLHDVQGLKHEEIAETVGCSVGTSKSQLFKARMRIRKCLNARPAGEEKQQ